MPASGPSRGVPRGLALRKARPVTGPAKCAHSLRARLPLGEGGQRAWPPVFSLRASGTLCPTATRALTFHPLGFGPCPREGAQSGPQAAAAEGPFLPLPGLGTHRSRGWPMAKEAWVIPKQPGNAFLLE